VRPKNPVNESLNQISIFLMEESFRENEAFLLFTIIFFVLSEAHTFEE